ncbi:serine hydrolase domain-containing protein [Fodinicola acaciae]|uniref:serine hydrolase domain-containing protein n=1 Tax=Fodinicola acaciae TaxID=2681555 RepID=UPI0013D38928|nr:serine hydrolase domain-containing protein [Fodinicola acaciae]
MTQIHGFVAAGFDGVAEAFRRNFDEHGEVGASIAAYWRGQQVVDLWGGQADPDAGLAWQQDTLQLIFSGTKGLLAACVLLLVERGQVDLAAPLARYWPEFGKPAVTVGDVLSHQSRLPGVPGGVTTSDLLDGSAMAKHLAAQEPETDPRAGFMYHALTYGWLVGELIRRVDGRDAGRFFADEFARPLRLDIWIGLPDELHHRSSRTIAGPGVLAPPEPDDPLHRLVRNPLLAADAPDLWNSAAFRRAGMPAVGAYATARAMARFYGCLAAGGSCDGIRVLAESTIALGRQEIRRGVEPTWRAPMAYAAGFELWTPAAHLGPPRDAFGHAGAGGSRHGAWPALGVGFSYAMNQLRADTPDPRPLVLLDALHSAIC